YASDVREEGQEPAVRREGRPGGGADVEETVNAEARVHGGPPGPFDKPVAAIMHISAARRRRNLYGLARQRPPGRLLRIRPAAYPTTSVCQLRDFLAGTLPPFLRALDSPMAMACLRLRTGLPDLPLLSFPCFISRIASCTSSFAFCPYLLATVVLLSPGAVERLADSGPSRALIVQYRTA